MQIDWLTLVAQVVNFVILLVLLHRFLYRPIMGVMAEREREIAERLDQADAARDEAVRVRAELEEAKKGLEREREARLDEAREEAAEERDRLLARARDEVEEKRRRWRRALERERSELADEIERRLTGVVRDAVERALGSLASASFDARVHEVFLARLRALDDQRRAELGDAAAGGEALVRTAFELSRERRDELESALAEVLGDDAEIRFEVADELAAGIEVAVGDLRVAWSVRDYLEGLDDAVSARLRERREEER
ncbi:MAG TPA: F0F1 ATP synthase subunit delta [Candidatus Sulfomarinibacteraceae bacterium]|nr:F0F1 ATP synthase subunit delta [Candidatus Sulfomarinibacteraceae bacterium]